MKVPYPRSIPMGYAMSFCMVLMLAQLLEGTDVLLATLSFVFIIVSVAAFNLAGGMYYPSGAFVASCSLLTCIVGLVVKAVLGEPAQTNLLNPTKTMGVYAAGMISMYGAVYVSHRYRKRTGVLEGFQITKDVRAISVGCLLIAVLPDFLGDSSGLGGSWVQFGYFFGYLAILLPVYFRVKETEGRYSFGIIPFLAWLSGTVIHGLLTFSKQGLFSSSVCWAVAAAAAGYRLNPRRILALGLALALVPTILTPYAQVGRDREGGDTLDGRIAIMMDLLSRPLEVREEYGRLSAEAFEQSDTEYHWFNKPQGLLDRLNMFSIDDALVYYTDNGVKSNLVAVWSYFLNLIPRYLWPNKPYLNWGNTYAHQIGMLAPNDFSTGISFSPFADAYHTGEWLGITGVFFVIFALVFWAVDSMSGDIDRSIWGLLYVMIFSHTAPEGMLGFPIYTLGTTTIAILIAAFLITRVAPLLGAVLSLPERRLLKSI